MRILIVAPKNLRFKHISAEIMEEFKNFYVESSFELVTVESFSFDSSYFKKKITKLGIKTFENNYNENLKLELETRCKNFQPDFILVLDGANVPVPVQKFLAQYKIILWLWESFKSQSTLQNFINYAEEIFCFEYEDLKFLAEKGKSAHYLPLGANDKIYFPREVERDIDISFIGLASKERLEFLNKVCERALQKNWKVKIGGIFYDKKHFWKKYIFRYRQEYLAKFIDNRIFSAEEVAELYCRSKICLNINTKVHRSLSPRTFEICATKSFQLMNSGQNSNGLMNLETDLVTFDGADDLPEKIEFYLANDELREKIALAGYNSVMKNCTIRKSVERLLTESEIIRGLN